MTATDKRDKLRAMIQAAGVERLVEELTAKGARVHVRVSETEKRDIEEMAHACGLTVTEYIVRLHRLAKEGLSSLKKGRGGARG